MVELLTTLVLITGAAALAPLISAAIPHRLLPEVVVLMTFGVILGPHASALVTNIGDLELLRELGLGMLFLMAGYEIETQELTGKGGRRALVAWLISLACAIGVMAAFGQISAAPIAGFAVAIALTSTALGTILPILDEQDLLGTKIGNTILNHGAVGEVGAVVAMALLLGTRGAGVSILVLALFLVISAMVLILPLGAQSVATRATRVLRLKAETPSQALVRLTMFMLIGMLALAAALELDVILGAFTAGFVLRRVVPDKHLRTRLLEKKLDAIGYGFLIPLFFVVSGMAIDPRAMLARPHILIGFFILMVAVRGIPVYAAMRTDKNNAFTRRQSGQVALFSATNLPIIVAVTDVAVHAGVMEQVTSSVLVTAGALSVLVLPKGAEFLMRGGKDEDHPDEVHTDSSRKPKETDPATAPEAADSAPSAPSGPSEPLAGSTGSASSAASTVASNAPASEQDLRAQSAPSPSTTAQGSAVTSHRHNASDDAAASPGAAPQAGETPAVTPKVNPSRVRGSFIKDSRPPNTRAGATHASSSHRTGAHGGKLPGASRPAAEQSAEQDANNPSTDPAEPSDS